MSEKRYITSRIREAELYRKQGLMEESRERYTEVMEYVQSHPHLSQQTRLVETLRERIEHIDNELADDHEVQKISNLSSDVQDLIRSTFVFSKSEDAAALEWAEALSGFGQHEEALKEFYKLLSAGVFPLAMARNIIRSHLSLSAPEAAVSDFKGWVASRRFSKEELNYLRSFLERELNKSPTAARFSISFKDDQDSMESLKRKEDALGEITSLRIQMSKEGSGVETLEIDVQSQIGNTVRALIPSYNAGFVRNLKSGVRLTEMRIYSRMAVFSGSGIVSKNAQVAKGPGRGDYVLEITLDT